MIFDAKIDCIVVRGIFSVVYNHDSLEQSGSYMFQLAMCVVNFAKPEHHNHWFV
jgi:hypothetical protein